MPASPFVEACAESLQCSHQQLRQHKTPYQRMPKTKRLAPILEKIDSSKMILAALTALCDSLEDMPEDVVRAVLMQRVQDTRQRLVRLAVNLQMDFKEERLMIRKRIDMADIYNFEQNLPLAALLPLHLPKRYLLESLRRQVSYSELYMSEFFLGFEYEAYLFNGFPSVISEPEKNGVFVGDTFYTAIRYGEPIYPQSSQRCYFFLDEQPIGESDGYIESAITPQKIGKHCYEIRAQLEGFSLFDSLLLTKKICVEVYE